MRRASEWRMPKVYTWKRSLRFNRTRPSVTDDEDINCQDMSLT